jgi:quercetin dioxygenase-like cupin family protein
VKRVVTGWTSDGTPAILFEGEPPAKFGFGDIGSSEIWSTTAVPAPCHESDDPTAGDFAVEPPIGGTIFRIATYQPGANVEVHATQTVDYVIVLEGELTMIFDDRSVTLHAGDVVVQQATPHGWENRASTPCVVAAVLMTAEGATPQTQLHWP